MSASSHCMRLFSIGAVAALITVVGCSSNGTNIDGDNVSTSEEEALTPSIPASLCGRAALTTMNGIPVYPNDCGDVNVWTDDGIHTARASEGSSWVETEVGYGYQCVEFAARYMHFRYGTSTHWGAAVAADMCTHHPSDVTETSSPIDGDLVVIKPGECGLHSATAGHVAVISSVTSTAVGVVQQNEGSTGKGAWARSCAKCYLHAARNDVCNDVANGTYCGDTNAFKGGKKGTLYVCDGNELKSSKACADGCEGDSGKTDECEQASDAGDADAIEDDAGNDETNVGEDSGAASSVQGGDAVNASTDVGNSGDSGGGCAVAPNENGDPRFAMLLAALGLFAITRRRRA